MQRMLFCMRTTLNLDDELMRNVKQQAAATGRSLTEVIELYLRLGLVGEQTPRAGYRLGFTTVSGQLLPGVDVTDRDSLYERMEGRG